MTPEALSSAVNDRLDALRERGAACPLWLEPLAPEQALAELEGREGPIFDLQRGCCLTKLGRLDEASAVVDRLTTLPAGLWEAREGLRKDLAADVPGPSAPERARGQESPAIRLEDWLQRILQWRRRKGV